MSKETQDLPKMVLNILPLTYNIHVMIRHPLLLQIIRGYSSKKGSSDLLLQDLTEYIRRYAKHYLQQKPELVPYIEISNDELLDIVKEMTEEGVLSFTTTKKNVTIFVPYFYIESVGRLYKDIERREDIPFPLVEDLPHNFPKNLLKRIGFDDEFMHIVPDDTNDFLYLLSFSTTVKSMLFPANYTYEQLLAISIRKLQFYFRKDEAKDYLQKRLLTANPSKDSSVRSFVIKIQAKDMGLIRSIKEADDTYLLWSQLCAFIKQDIDKKNEKLPDEESLLQAISIVDFLNNYYRGAHQKDIQKQTALKNLSLAFHKPPYYFTIKNITDFVDSRGIPLLGQYAQNDLTDFLQRKTSTCESFSVPDILTFKNSEGERFYVYADKVIPLVISLITESREAVKNACVEKWFSLLKSFRQDVAMKNDVAFHSFIKDICEQKANNIYSILSSSFMQALILDKKINDTQAGEIARLYPDGKLAAYGDILMLNRVELLNDAKILLPFYYTLPVISSIISFFIGQKKDKNKKDKKQDAKANIELKDIDTRRPKKKKKITFRDVAQSLKKEMVPSGLSLEEALQKYLDLWNTTINKKARDNLTEDVNVFIRDYMRGIQRSLPVSSFDQKRVQELAKTVVESNSLAKIKDKRALLAYCELYILKIAETSLN